MSQSANTVKIAVAGAAGRMGLRLTAITAETSGAELVSAFERPGHPALGQHAPAPAGPVAITDAYDGSADVLIDFTLPESTRTLLPRCVETNTAIVIGTTGLTAEDHAAIDEAAKSIAIVQAPNMSLGVNLLFALAARAAQQLGDDYDIEIVETHHRFKKDAPSGTALGIAESICKATGKDPASDLVYTRHGGECERERGKITMQSLRMGDVVGEHTAYFATLGERVELSHVATSRDTFARGAVRAALWLGDKKSGRFTMKDVLGLDD
ncbi:4-hydroxy-tetrahydrodipicolinate reductase [Planctomycetales bacterium ZRK34]|nr:4-hydroxy-tetrahydrodipicolinate reductase [Planctomycetales bacterium ZRK34]